MYLAEQAFSCIPSPSILGCYAPTFIPQNLALLVEGMVDLIRSTSLSDTMSFSQGAHRNQSDVQHFKHEE